MADDWEENDWESESFKPVLPAVTKETKPVSTLAADVDMSKFADEDADLDKEEKKHVVPASQPKKKEEKKYTKASLVIDDTPLDDPIAEKARRQRLEEQADYAAAKELFGDENQLNLDSFLPKSLKDYEDYAAALVSRYVLIHRDAKNYKAFLKALIKKSCDILPSTEVKDVETSLAGLRSDKFKAEQAEAAAKKGVKKSLNIGKAGVSAGLDDYIYDDAGQGDDFDFM